MAVRLLDESLHRVLGLGVKERSCYPNVSDVLLEDWSRFHWADFVSKHRFSRFASPQRHLLGGSDIVDPAHWSIWRHEPPSTVVLHKDHRCRSLLATVQPGGGEEKARLASDPMSEHCCHGYVDNSTN